MTTASLSNPIQLKLHLCFIRNVYMRFFSTIDDIIFNTYVVIFLDLDIIITMLLYKS